MKFVGEIGFWTEDTEIEPGIWRSGITEKHYIGDVLRNNRSWAANTESTNSNLTISNEISIISDLYAQQNCESIKYVKWNGVKWKVSNVTIDYPRIKLSLGGLYNGKD